MYLRGVTLSAGLAMKIHLEKRVFALKHSHWHSYTRPLVGENLKRSGI